MIIISTRDFRGNQTKYLDIANRGEDVVLKSRKSGSFKILPITNNDVVIDKRDIATEIKGALQQAKEHLEGKLVLKSADSLLDEIRNSTL